MTSYVKSSQGSLNCADVDGGRILIKVEKGAQSAELNLALYANHIYVQFVFFIHIKSTWYSTYESDKCQIRCRTLSADSLKEEGTVVVWQQSNMAAKQQTTDRELITSPFE